MRATSVMAVAGALCALMAAPSRAFIYNTGHDIPATALNGGLRWDASPRIVDGEDRSLVGGISWNMQGGTFATYKSQFTWNVTPTDAQFQAAIENAFGYWLAPDPNPLQNTAAPFSFVRAPAAVSTVGPKVGAEIDLLVADQGFVGMAGGALSHPIDNDYVKLTSGTTNYPSDAIGGVDVYLNNREGTIWNLTGFRSVLLHEIGHCLGMGHPDIGLVGRFVDDNYDGTSEVTANATLNNSFSHLINPLNPSNSPQLNLYTVPNNTRGTNASGVNIVMERFVGPSPEGVNPLSSDDYAQRQFLYPVQVPEPTAGVIVLLATASLLLFRGRRPGC